MSKKLTLEQVITRGNQIHNNAYDYSKIEEILGLYIKYPIICKIHGIFTQSMYRHLKGRTGCKKCARIKYENTMFIRHGVTHNSKSIDTKERKKQTYLKNHGVDNPFKSSKIKNTIQNIHLNNLGVDNPSKSEIIKRKKMDTCFTNHEVYNPFQSIQIQNIIKQNNKNNSGVEYSSQIHMNAVLPLLEDFDWLYNQYIVLGKTAVKIGDDLNVQDTTIRKYLIHHEIELKNYIGYSYTAIHWLESIMQQEQIFIQHARNIGEYKIPNTKYSVDGYCQETNTCYEFHGDIWHGNLQIYQSNEYCNPFSKLTAGELYQKTIDRENYIKQQGYNLIVMWENDYNLLNTCNIS